MGVFAFFATRAESIRSDRAGLHETRRDAPGPGRQAFFECAAISAAWPGLPAYFETNAATS